MAEENKFLEIVDLKKGYGSGETRQEVLRRMTFSVARGEICVLLGPSGSGKSSTAASTWVTSFSSTISSPT